MTHSAHAQKHVLNELTKHARLHTHDSNARVLLATSSWVHASPGRLAGPLLCPDERLRGGWSDRWSWEMFVQIIGENRAGRAKAPFKGGVWHRMQRRRRGLTRYYDDRRGEHFKTTKPALLSPQDSSVLLARTHMLSSFFANKCENFKEKFSPSRLWRKPKLILSSLANASRRGGWREGR